MKWIVKILLFLFVSASVLFIAVFKRPVNKIEYEDTRLFEKTREQLGELTIQPPVTGDNLQVGWAKKNITPSYPVRMAGYGLRPKFDSVLDSLHVRTMIFSLGETNIAMISYDLMIVPPALARSVRKKLEREKIAVDHVFFGAVHSHTSIGEWGDAFGLELVFGKYNKVLIGKITRQTVLSIQEALISKQVATIASARFPTINAVKNHFGNDLYLDSLMRSVKIRKENGEIGFVNSFSAHSNYLHPNYTGLSADYPGVMNKTLEEEDSVSFSMFFSGAVANHQPTLKFVKKDSVYSYRNYETLQKYGKYFASVIKRGQKEFVMKSCNSMNYVEVPLFLPHPQVRINDRIGFRPWSFYLLLGRHEPSIQFFKLGNLVFIGTPCDISGEFYKYIQPVEHDMDLNVILTSFNGEYIGYLIPDEHYLQARSEAREMNWYGPAMGSHFIHVVNSVLNQLP